MRRAEFSDTDVNLIALVIEQLLAFLVKLANFHFLIERVLKLLSAVCRGCQVWLLAAFALKIRLCTSIDHLVRILGVEVRDAGRVCHISPADGRSDGKLSMHDPRTRWNGLIPTNLADAAVAVAAHVVLLPAIVMSSVPCVVGMIVARCLIVQVWLVLALHLVVMVLVMLLVHLLVQVAVHLLEVVRVLTWHHGGGRIVGPDMVCVVLLLRWVVLVALTVVVEFEGC